MQHKLLSTTTGLAGSWPWQGLRTELVDKNSLSSSQRGRPGWLHKGDVWNSLRHDTSHCDVLLLTIAVHGYTNNEAAIPNRPGRQIEGRDSLTLWSEC